MAATILLQQVFHVFEKFHVPALIAGNGNTLRIFFNGGFNNFVYTTVMTEMNNFGAFALHNAAHDVDSGIVAIE
jgi:hypothetical protein